MLAPSIRANDFKTERSSKFAPPPLVVETPSHRAAMERQPVMICIERIGMVRPRRLARRLRLPTCPPFLEGGRSWTRIGGHR